MEEEFLWLFLTKTTEIDKLRSSFNNILKMLLDLQDAFFNIKPRLKLKRDFRYLDIVWNAALLVSR